MRIVDFTQLLPPATLVGCAAACVAGSKGAVPAKCVPGKCACKLTLACELVCYQLLTL